MRVATAMTLEKDGAVRHDRAALSCLDDLKRAIATLSPRPGGIRIYGHDAIRRLIGNDGPIAAIANAWLGNGARPVRAVLFDKTPAANWALGWHQDRTIAVCMRRPIPDFERWTRKQGLTHVEPPFSIIERMLTIRIHIDAAGADNAPLLVAPGSHRCGKLAEDKIGDIVDRLGSLPCLAEAGDVWVYATPIVHASAASQRAGHRRVLQVDYSADLLPHGLEWLGV